MKVLLYTLLFRLLLVLVWLLSPSGVALVRSDTRWRAGRIMFWKRSDSWDRVAWRSNTVRTDLKGAVPGVFGGKGECIERIGCGIGWSRREIVRGRHLSWWWIFEEREGRNGGGGGGGGEEGQGDGCEGGEIVLPDQADRMGMGNVIGGCKQHTIIGTERKYGARTCP